MVDNVNISLEEKDILIAEDYRKKFKTSVLVIFFTDIESSTKLREDLGDKGYTELLEKHDSILLPLVNKYNGLHLKSIGDSILAVFSQPSDAVECAIAIQDAIYNSPLIKPFLRVRIGMDMGQVAKEQLGGIMKDVFGRFVNRAARIEGLAAGGHIFCSDAVQDNASGWIDSTKIKWHDHGFQYVKGVDKPLSVWEPYNSNITDYDKTISATPSELISSDEILGKNKAEPKPKLDKNVYNNIKFIKLKGFILAQDQLLKEISWVDAVEYSKTLSIDEIKSWQLPTIDQLKDIRSASIFPNKNCYWSKNEMGRNQAEYMHFDDGHTGAGPKTYHKGLCAIFISDIDK